MPNLVQELKVEVGFLLRAESPSPSTHNYCRTIKYPAADRVNPIKTKRGEYFSPRYPLWHLEQSSERTKKFSSNFVTFLKRYKRCFETKIENVDLCHRYHFQRVLC